MSEIRVTNIVGENGNDAVTFTKGVSVTGVTTATTFSGSGASLTNIPDSALSAVTASKLTGALPAISGANLTGIAAGGKLLQVVQYSTTTQFSTTSGSFVDVTNFNANIVPQTNSKVLVQVTLMSILTSATSGGEGYGIKILRGSTGVLTSGGMYDIYDNANVSGAHSKNRSTWTVLDSSPGGDGSTTLTYKIQVFGDGQDVMINRHFDPNTGPDYGRFASTMIAMEIGA